MKTKILPLIILSLLFGTVVFAQKAELPSPGLTPDSPFYFLKSWKESIRTFFTFGAENKAKQFLHLAEVRLAEYQKMIEKQKIEIAQKTLVKYERQLNRALEKTEEAKEKGKDVEELATLITERTLKHQEVLSEVFGKVPEEAKKGIENTIEMSKKGYETAIGAVSEIKKRERMKKECLEEGEIYMPGEDRQCCAGLERMTLTYGDGTICTLPMGYVCTAFCGDGKCQGEENRFSSSPFAVAREGEYENACSCPDDCLQSYELIKKYAPECIEAGATTPDECAKFYFEKMHSVPPPPK